ncbi:TPA: phosphate-binding protein [bacterium]|nr:phosphate-binding protein [bacterium]
MNKRGFDHWVTTLLIVLGLMLGGCGRAKREITITLSGSTSVQPFAERLAEEYTLRNPEVRIDVQGGGSTAGIRAVKTGICHLGMSSRELKEDEKDLNRILIARDGLAIVIHPTNPLDDISLDDVQRIFAGELSNWKGLSGIDHPIYPITREEGSGTREAFTGLIMKQSKISPGTLVQDSSGAVREAIATNPYAIGYISLGLVNERVKALNIDGVTPTKENIDSGAYPLTRPFLFVSMEEPKGKIKEFVDFVLSSDGQKILEEEGLLSAR